MEEYISTEAIEKAFGRIEDLKRLLRISDKEKSIAQLEEKSLSPEFWNDSDKAGAILQKLKSQKDVVAIWKKANEDARDIHELYELVGNEEGSEELAELRPLFKKLQKKIQNLEFLLKMNDEDDVSNAIVTIHSGAGGTESCDWADMLFRMYLRWFERKGFSAEIIESQPGDGAGIKTATVEVKGEYAFGYLKAESGVHRLVRISPFDSNARRHTSFASVYSYPVIEEDDTVVIDKNDIRVDTYRASGAGGQHVNKTDSAVRITHLETGIVVQCQSQRSQIKNRESAMKMLKSRLRQYNKEQEQKEKDEKSGTKKKIEWGSQIRSYVMHPYNMVKDHRTGFETSNVDAVLDGDIDAFIEKFLLESN
jgi:peptide chain release factor 2